MLPTSDVILILTNARDMESPVRTQRASRSGNTMQPGSLLRSLFNNSGSTHCDPDEHPAFRKKCYLLNSRIFGGRNGSAAPEVNTTSTNTNSQSSDSREASTSRTAGSSPRRNLTSQTSRHWRSPISHESPSRHIRGLRERRHADAAALIRRSRRRGCLRAYLSSAVKNREVQKNLIRCGVAGFLLIAILATCMILPPSGCVYRELTCARK